MIEAVPIIPDAVYDDGALLMVYGITPTAMANARSSGSLRHVVVGKRVLYLGQWLLDWLESEAVPKTAKTKARNP